MPVTLMEKLQQFSERQRRYASEAQYISAFGSQAEVISLSGNSSTDCEDTVGCRKSLHSLLHDRSNIVLQLIPSYLGSFGNEKADLRAKQGFIFP